MKTTKLLAIAVAAATIAPRPMQAAILYSTLGSTYTQNFDSLPTDAPNNANIESVYPNGWRDDTTTVPGSHVSLPGWYLYHPLLSSEGGDNDHQRLRFGDGSSAVGAFYAFANGPNAAANAEKSLGTLPTDELALQRTNVTQPMRLFIGLRMINNTGHTLKRVRVRYDGEQWRDGSVLPINPEFLELEVGTQSTVDNWFSDAQYFNSGFPDDFSAPVSANSNAAVDGNGAGKRAGIVGAYGVFFPIGHVDWLPGEELWIRWSHTNDNGAGDGLAIDNVSVTAFVPEPTSAALIGIALLGLAKARRRI